MRTFRPCESEGCGALCMAPYVRCARHREPPKTQIRKTPRTPDTRKHRRGAAVVAPGWESW